MGNLAVTCQYLGRLEAPKVLMVRVTSLRKEIYGPRNLETLTSLSAYSSLLCDKGKFEEAGQLAEETLRLRRDILPFEYPDVLLSMLNAAFISACLGRLEESPVLRTQRRLKILGRIKGDKDPMTIAGIVGLVRLYSNKETSQALWEEAGVLGVRPYTYDNKY